MIFLIDVSVIFVIVVLIIKIVIGAIGCLSVAKSEVASPT
jgi:hypothetical protein